MLKALIFYFSCLVVIQGFQFPSSRWSRNVVTEWHGKWFPQEPGYAEDDNEEVDYQPIKNTNLDEGANSYHHDIPMGIPNDLCDNAKDNLTIDWDNAPIEFTCYDDKRRFLPNPDVYPILHCDHIPVHYHAEHVCTNTSIMYEDQLPTFGSHRPLWAKYGEYEYLPKQRWLHNLEHGAVVMLYHPCANKNEVLFLKHLVQRCLFRHIITPYNYLTQDRPLALLTWGCRFMMSKVDVKLVVEYIKRTALQGPEFISIDGQFDYALQRHANIISDKYDSVLCPNLV